MAIVGIEPQWSVKSTNSSLPPTCQIRYCCEESLGGLHVLPPMTRRLQHAILVNQDGMNSAAIA
jgi:hypothetical protein